MLDFHSFRHTVRTKLTEASIPEDLIDDIIGHASTSGSIGRRVYTHSQLIPQKKEAIEKITYDLDFGKLKRWEHCRFRRDFPKR
jgi:intergrase/recombinase